MSQISYNPVTLDLGLWTQDLEIWKGVLHTAMASSVFFEIPSSFGVQALACSGSHRVGLGRSL
jgi:hypothetical protein